MSDYFRECTQKCKSKQHAQCTIGAVIRNVSNEKVASYLHALCCNFSNLVDQFGRTVLHMSASCKNRTELVDWLIKKYRVDLTTKDLESGWTALHRSLFYGQISTACLLIKHDASLSTLDYDGYSPLDLLMKDANNFKTAKSSADCKDLYVCGSNTNFSLGEQSQQHRQFPTLVEYFIKNNVNLSQVVMKKYHSVFLSHDGAIYSCGHGQDGRLGLETEQTRMLPCQIKFPGHQKTASKLSIVQVAAGDNHTIFLASSGEVFTCGLNNCHQLGHNPAPEKLLKPTKLNFKFASSVQSVHAATFHTVICLKDSIYSCGLNAGQLGHPKGERTQLNFRKISRLNQENINITHISVSNGATVCVIDNKFIYIFHEYKFNKLPAFPNIEKIEVIGGNLDYSCDPKILSKVGLPLRILVLNSEGNVYLHENSSFQLTRCIFSFPRQPFITDISCNVNGVLLITDDGEGFRGVISSPMKARHGKSKPVHSGNAKNSHKTIMDDSFQNFVDINDCFQIKLNRLTHIHRGVKVYSDLQGKSFSVLQYQPSSRVDFSSDVDFQACSVDYKNLLTETFSGDGIQDVVIEVDGESFPAHKFILASCSSYFRQLFLAENHYVNEENYFSIKIENASSATFHAMLEYIYFGDYSKLMDMMLRDQKPKIKAECSCLNFDTEGMSAYQVKQKSNGEKCSVCNDEKYVHSPVELSKKFGLKTLTSRLTNTKSKYRKSYCDQIQFKQRELPELGDVTIISSDNVEFRCHKCILVARSNYFKGMFMSCWIEASSNQALQLQENSDILKVLLDFIYEDTIRLDSATKDVDFICGVLAAANQYLIEQLKNHCEIILIGFVSLKNVAEILQFSSIYNAEFLLKFSVQYICHNLAALLETRSLEILDQDILDLVSQAYREVVPSMCNRLITPFSTSPTSDDIEEIAAKYPIVLSEVTPARLNEGELNRTKSASTANRARRRSQSQRQSSSISEEQCLAITPESPTIKEIPELIQRNAKVSVETPVTEELCLQRPSNTPDGSSINPSESNENFPSLGRVTGVQKNSSLKEPNFNESVPDDSTINRSESDMNFPSLGKVIGVHKNSPHGHIEKSFGSKLSQKQKKKLAAIKKESSTVVLKNDENQKISTNPWHKVKDDMPISLKDIMNSEKKTVDQNYSESFPKKQQFSPKPPNSAFSWNLHEVKPAVNPVSDNSKAWDNSSPDNTDLGSKVENQDLNFIDILQNEEKASAQLVRIQTKPLELIQIEDRAIEELKEHYKAVDNPNEFITIQRVTTCSSATPIWQKKI